MYTVVYMYCFEKFYSAAILQGNFFSFLAMHFFLVQFCWPDILVDFSWLFLGKGHSPMTSLLSRDSVMRIVLGLQVVAHDVTSFTRQCHENRARAISYCP